MGLICWQLKIAKPIVEPQTTKQENKHLPPFPWKVKTDFPSLGSVFTNFSTFIPARAHCSFPATFSAVRSDPVTPPSGGFSKVLKLNLSYLNFISCFAITELSPYADGKPLWFACSMFLVCISGSLAFTFFVSLSRFRFYNPWIWFSCMLCRSIYVLGNQNHVIVKLGFWYARIHDARAVIVIVIVIQIAIRVVWAFLGI